MTATPEELRALATEAINEHVTQHQLDWDIEVGAAELLALLDERDALLAEVARLKTELAVSAERAVTAVRELGTVLAAEVTAHDSTKADVAALRGELDARGKGHEFEGGTPEAMRDARLRNEIFNCVEQHPTKPKIATWHYAKALQLISDYRAEVAALRGAGLYPETLPDGQRVMQPSASVRVVVSPSGFGERIYDGRLREYERLVTYVLAPPEAT